ncbi:MAG: S8 family peptidase [Bacteroidota bacterium]
MTQPAQRTPFHRQIALVICFFSLLSSFSLFAQNTCLDRRLSLLATDESCANLAVSVLIKGPPSFVAEQVIQAGGTIRYTVDQITSASLPAHSLMPLSKIPGIIRMESAEIGLKPLNDRMRTNNRISLVHQGLTPLPKAYEGKDVVMGIIDTGIDFTHPDFLDSTGLSRVEWVWDHLLADSANTPTPYGYGQEFSKADIDAGLASAHIDQTAHGTHVTGIAAAGGDTLYTYRGAAPKSKIIAVSLDFSLDNDSWLSSIADAVHYIFSKSDSLGLPCVVNISAGTYFGSHDGLDLTAQVIDNLIAAQNGRMVVAAAGNAGGYPIHLRHQPLNDTLFTWLRSSNNNPIYAECWSDSADFAGLSLSVSADSPAPFFQTRATTPWFSVDQLTGQLITDTLKSPAGDRIGLMQSYREYVAGRYGLMLYIVPDSNTYLFRINTCGSGSFDAWSFDLVYNNLPAPGAYPPIIHYITPDVQQNICSSFQCGQRVICTGQYVNRNNYIDVNGNTQTFPTTVGALALSSSRGPTRDGRTKPDITSTGEVTMAALRLSSVAWFVQNQPYKLAADSIHIRDGGTSSAAPAVAGAIALYLESQPLATWTDIRNRVLLCSRTDAFTGTNLPNNDWGHGKLDALSLMTGCAPLALPSLPATESAGLQLAPNPSNGNTWLELEVPVNQARLRIFDAQGKLLLQRDQLQGRRFPIELSEHPDGLYYIRLDESGTMSKSITLLIGGR